MSMRNVLLSILIKLGLNLVGLTQTNWTLHKKEAAYTIWLKDVPNEKIKQFKLEAIIKGNFEDIHNIMKDVEKMHLWYDKVKNVKLLKKINENEAIYLLAYDLPFPFEDRIATIKGIMNYNPKLGTLTVNTAYFPYTLSKDKNASLLIKKISSSWEIKKLSDGQLNIVHSGYMDPGGNIPSWVVNESITSGPVETLKGLKKRLLAYK